MRREKIVQVALGLAVSLMLAAAARADIITRIVGYWPLEGSGTDAGPNELHGTVNGTVTAAADRFGYGDSAMSFPGVAGSNVTIGDQPQLNITGALTLAAWVFLNKSNPNNGRIIAKAGGSGARSWSLNTELTSGGVSNPATFQVASSASTNVSLVDTQPLPLDTWVHMVGVYRPGEAMEIYVNGDLHRNNTTNIPASHHSNNGLAVLIGDRHGATNCAWSGLIDEARVYARALSAADVKELYTFKPSPRLKAWKPDPADGAEGVVTPLLGWKPGATAALHDVYIGTSPDLGPADLVGVHSPLPMFWYGAGFVPGTTYLWKVDEIEADMKTLHTGDVWRFTAAPVTAYKPSPYDGALWIDPNADLSWTAGLNAAAHEVYFGTDEAAVAAGTGGTAKGRLGVSTFDPGPLQPQTRYFWKIDEVDAGSNKQPGPVWSFTTIGTGGGIKGQYFTSIDLTGDPAVTRLDPKVDFTWADGATAGTNSPDAAIPTDGFSCRWTADLQVDRADAYTFVTRSDDGVRLFLDGKRLLINWTNHSAADNFSEPVQLVPGRVYSLVMEMYENTGSAAAQLAWQSPSMSRRVITRGPLQAPLHAGMPSPANGAVDVPQTVTLSWRPGDDATQHEVYFGEDAQAVADATTATAGIYRGRQALDASTFDAGELEWAKTYAWRIDEVGAATLKGSVWSFTTADFLVIDDFEGYTDDEGSRIYQTWTDGYTSGANGSVVGYFQAPFAEQAIVNTGNQSMPLDFNNVNSPYYSEAERLWSTTQNWTADDVNTLVVHVRGRGTNAAEPLYVVLEDSSSRSAVAVHPDPAVLTSTKWVEWKIPLSDFGTAGVSLTRIKKLYIGVGSRTNTAPGGAGRIYIDDIRVAK